MKETAHSPSQDNDLIKRQKEFELIKKVIELDSEMELLRVLKENEVDQKDYYKYWEKYRIGKTRRKGIPINGCFELTPLCNLDCKMCYIHRDQNLPEPQLLSIAQWKDIMGQAIEAGMQNATLTGGECLTYPGFEALYLYLFNQGISLSVLTNGILLNEEKIEFFRQYPPLQLQVSLYGSAEAGYEKVTGHRKYGTVVKNIKKALDAGLPLQIAVTPSRFMRGDIKETLKTAYALTNKVNLNPGLFDCFEETGKKDEENDISIEEYVELYQFQANLQGKTLPVPDRKKIVQDAQGYPAKKAVPFNSEPPGKGVKCGAGRNNFYISYDGWITPCGMMREPKYAIAETGFANAWQGINAFVSNYPVQAECCDCIFEGSCPVCVVLHERGAEKGHANPYFCRRARIMYAHGLLDLYSEKDLECE